VDTYDARPMICRARPRLEETDKSPVDAALSNRRMRKQLSLGN